MDEALLDTDILSEVLKQRHPLVRQKAAQYLMQHNRFAFSVFTQFEIVRGYKEKNAVRQLQRFEGFCQRSSILPADDTVFERAGELWVAARRGGHAHADADLIIAVVRRKSQLVPPQIDLVGRHPFFELVSLPFQLPLANRNHRLALVFIRRQVH